MSDNWRDKLTGKFNNCSQLSTHLTMSLVSERLHGRAVKTLVNHFGGPASIPSTGSSESKLDGEIFALVPDVALNGCELHVKPHFNFTFHPAMKVQWITMKLTSHIHQVTIKYGYMTLWSKSSVGHRPHVDDLTDDMYDGLHGPVGIDVIEKELEVTDDDKLTRPSLAYPTRPGDLSSTKPC